MSEAWLVDLGLMPYGEAWDLQRQVVRARRDGRVPDVLLLVEHPPVITIGRTGDETGLRSPRAALAARGIELFEVERGGMVTYHGPGQLVGYPIVSLDDHRRDLHWFLRSVEEVLIRGLGTLHLQATRRSGMTGVWLPQGKVAAIGVAVRHWVTYHGFALNVSTDLGPFELIDPCGLAQEGVTSMAAALGRRVPMGAVKDSVARAFGEVFGVELGRPQNVCAFVERICAKSGPEMRFSAF